MGFHIFIVGYIFGIPISDGPYLMFPLCESVRPTSNEKGRDRFNSALANQRSLFNLASTWRLLQIQVVSAEHNSGSYRV